MPQQSQHASPVDPDFVATLRTDISGIFFASASRFAPDKIEQEFRKAVADPGLVADETFMHNLMFLVRKKEVRALHDDVERVLTKGGLTPRPEVSTMKTLYALGSSKDRVVIDERLSAQLESQLKSRDALAPSPYLESADRIGGAKTLNMLKAFQQEAARQQQQAEQKSPNDHVGIVQLDQMRSGAENKVFYLSLKLSVLAKDETDRATEMFKYYLRRTGFLGFWGYKELVDHPSPAAVNAIRGYISHRLEELLPGGGITAEDRSRLLLDYQLRGVCLLQAMKAELTPEEEKLLGDHAAMVNERKEFFRPGHDWEDVLDRS
jgi:hypothetical protein